MYSRVFAFVIAGLLALATPSVASAQGAGGGCSNDRVAQAREHYDNGEFQEAIQTLVTVIVQPGLSPSCEVRIYEILGSCYFALTRIEESVNAYRQVLIREGNHALARDLSPSPRMLEFYRGVRERWVAEGRPGLRPRGGDPGFVTPVGPRVTLDHQPPSEPPQANTPLNLTVSITDPGRRVGQVTLAYRPVGTSTGGRFDHAIAASAGIGEYRATVPAGAVRPPALEYYFEALDRVGTAIETRGTAALPLRLNIPEPGRPVPAWPFILGAGIVAVAVAVVVVVVVTRPQLIPFTLRIAGP
jgi:hypothetical protein